MALLGLLCSWSCASWKSVDRTQPSDPFERVERTIGANIDELREVLLERSSGQHYSEEIVDRFPYLGAFLIVGSDNDLFLDDGSIRVNFDRSPWMETYLDMGQEQRARDLYLLSVMDLFWASDYEYEGEPAKFYTDFFLHLEPVSENATRVEVFEFLPRIWVGKSFQLRPRTLHVSRPALGGPDEDGSRRFAGSD